MYCRNCGPHGEDLNSCPRCGEANAEFLRRNFGGERHYEQELEHRGREALVAEQQRAEEMRIGSSSPNRSGVRTWRLSRGRSRCHPSTVWLLFPLNTRRSRWVRRRYRPRLIKPARTDYFMSSFAIGVARLWNNLPVSVRAYYTCPCFKRLLLNHLLRIEANRSS